MLKRLFLWLKHNWEGTVYYSRAVQVKERQRPPVKAEKYWKAFTIGTLGLVLYTLGAFALGYGITLVGIVWAIGLTAAFIFGESSAVGLKLPFGFTEAHSTYSEYVWFYWPLTGIKGQLLRTLWGLGICVLVGMYLHVVLGILLALWLVPHLAMKGRFRELGT